MIACAKGELDKIQLNWANDHALTIVYAANGYPGKYKKETKILDLDQISESSNVQIFHAGTKLEKNNKIFHAFFQVMIIIIYHLKKNHNHHLKKNHNHQ